MAGVSVDTRTLLLVALVVAVVLGGAYILNPSYTKRMLRMEGLESGASTLSADANYVQEFKDPYSDMRANGIGLLSRVDIRWDHCDIKSTNLLANVLAIQDAKEAGCHEVLFHLKDGTITESAHSSLFGVLDGIIYTSPTSEWILPGITRDHILSVCAKEGIPLREKSLHLDQLEKVSELFITGTTCGVLPVATLDGKKIGNGKPGPVAQRVSDAYWKTVNEWANSESPEKGIGL